MVTKVAIIREEGFAIGTRAPVYLNCPCGEKPSTDIDTREDVLCLCGRAFTYNGWIK